MIIICNNDYLFVNMIASKQKCISTKKSSIITKTSNPITKKASYPKTSINYVNNSLNANVVKLIRNHLKNSIKTISLIKSSTIQKKAFTIKPSLQIKNHKFCDTKQKPITNIKYTKDIMDYNDRKDIQNLINIIDQVYKAPLSKMKPQTKTAIQKPILFDNIHISHEFLATHHQLNESDCALFKHFVQNINPNNINIVENQMKVIKYNIQGHKINPKTSGNNGKINKNPQKS